MRSAGERRYDPILPLGAGGMASVFVGRARGAAGFSRLVALKRAHPHVRDDAGLAAALEREARLASRIHHANVVSVLDVVEDDGDLVLVLDYVEGVSLDALAVGRPGGFGGVDPRTRARAALRIVLDVSAGLDAAHRSVDEDGRDAPIVHRDVSPSNILVGIDGVARLTDFGIAKSLEATAERTDTGSLKGKVAYMAPEYVEQQSSEPSVDLFSLAVVTWEALAGERLFRSATEIETLRRVLGAPVPDLGAIAPELAGLDPVLRRALSRRPMERHPSVAAFAAELEAVARAEDLVASHAEVSVIVERVSGATLAERRRALTEGSSPPPPSGRDDVSTVLVGRSRRRAVAIGAALVAAGACAFALSRLTPREARSDEVHAAAAAPAMGTGAQGGEEEGAASAPPEPPASGEPAGGPPAARTIPKRAPAHPASIPRKAPPNPYVR